MLASVFLPVAFFSGTTGILYKQFALTIVISMVLSAFVALSLTPTLCAALLRADEENHVKQKSFLQRGFDHFNDGFEQGIRQYEAFLHKVIAKKKYALSGFVIILALCGVLYKLVPSTYIPEEDQGYYMTSVTLPEAASLDRTAAVMKNISAQIEQQPGVATVMSMSYHAQS